MPVTQPRYGTLHEDYVATWAARPDDRPMWALNLMKYRPLADYRDGRTSTITGQEADDRYAPVEPLAKVGAEIALVAPVLHQCAGDDTSWDRVAVVRYPSRMAMVELDQLPEFQELHVHKDAGMEFTVVAATFPLPDADAVPAAGSRLLLELVADPAAPDLGAAVGGTLFARFDVEGVVIGDHRRWAQARWHRLDAAAVAALTARSPVRTTAAYAVVLDAWLDRMPELLLDGAAGAWHGNADWADNWTRGGRDSVHAEVMHPASGGVWLAQRPVTREEYAALPLPPGFVASGIGRAVADSAYFRRSPGAGQDGPVETRDIGGLPFARVATAGEVEPGRGDALVLAVDKHHCLRYAAGRTIEVLRGDDGADYVPQASDVRLAGADPAAARPARTLPAGWSAREVALTTDLFVEPPCPSRAVFLPGGDSFVGPVRLPADCDRHAVATTRPARANRQESPVDVLRTPDERFADLPDFPFAPRYATVPDGEGGTLRMHYLDEGRPDAPVVLLLHGEPSWSFLYRSMVPVLVDAGCRVVAPDLVGFGRSDKPARREDYTYARHVEWVRTLLFDHLGLTDVTFFGQDWGGLVGLRVVAEHPDRFARVAIGNTGLPTGDDRPSKAFLAWLDFSQNTPDFPVGAIVSGGVVSPMPPEVVAAYDAPFPDDRYKSGARVFPTLVPIGPEDPAAAANHAARSVLAAWDKPFLTLFSDSDPITGGGERWFQEHVPGAAGRPHATIEKAGHFLQEDKGPEVAEQLARFVAAG